MRQQIVTSHGIQATMTSVQTYGCGTQTVTKGNKSFKLYKEGDQVWIKGTNLKTVYPTAKLGPKHFGPFKILKQLSEAVY